MMRELFIGYILKTNFQGKKFSVSKRTEQKIAKRFKEEYAAIFKKYGEKSEKPLEVLELALEEIIQSRRYKFSSRERQTIIVSYLESNGKINRGELAEALDVSKRTISRDLSSILKSNITGIIYENRNYRVSKRFRLREQKLRVQRVILEISLGKFI